MTYSYYVKDIKYNKENFPQNLMWNWWWGCEIW